MKKLWSIILLCGVVFAQLPQPTMVGQDELKIPTLSINNFVNQAEIEGLEDTRVSWVLQTYLQKTLWIQDTTW